MIAAFLPFVVLAALAATDVVGSLPAMIREYGVLGVFVWLAWREVPRIRAWAQYCATVTKAIADSLDIKNLPPPPAVAA